MSIYVCKGCGDISTCVIDNAVNRDPGSAYELDCPHGHNNDVELIPIEGVDMSLAEIFKVVIIDFDGRNKDSGMNSEDSPFMKQMRKLHEAISEAV